MGPSSRSLLLFIEKLCHHSSAFLMSPSTKGEGGHIGFNADPGCGCDSLYPSYFVDQWVEFYHTCMDTIIWTSQRAD